jgi:hypothetical protein
VDLTEHGWRVRQGEAVWQAKPGMPALAGELVVVTNGGDCGFVQFSKSPFPLVTVRSEADRWQIEFPPQRRSFRGRGVPPARFGWLHLERAFRGRPLPESWKFVGQAGGDWRLENNVTGESIAGFLGP